MKILSKLTVLAVVALMAVSFASCKKACFECTDDFGNTAEFCEEELGKTATNLAVAAWESADNGVCTKK